MKQAIDHKPLLKFMLERHKIYLKRVAGEPAPWTKDPILQEYKFTNVYRQKDRVTIWVNDNISKPFANHPNLWFMLGIARQINWPPTLQALIADERCWPHDDWNYKATLKAMRSIAAAGRKVYTSAYIINANAAGKLGDDFDKPEATCKLTLKSVWDDRKNIEPRLHGTMADAHDALSQGHHGWGGFTSYEVVCDLRYTRYLQNAPDKLTWAHAGPGAERGLNRLLGREARARPRPTGKTAVSLMHTLLERVQKDWPHEPALEMREIEHSLCELDKYLRAKNGEGRPKSRFKPGENWGC